VQKKRKNTLTQIKTNINKKKQKERGQSDLVIKGDKTRKQERNYAEREEEQKKTGKIRG
jgi:hypothetical protein